MIRGNRSSLSFAKNGMFERLNIVSILVKLSSYKRLIPIISKVLSSCLDSMERQGTFSSLRYLSISGAGVKNLSAAIFFWLFKMEYKICIPK